MTMACTVESYPAAVVPTYSYLQDEAVLLETSWLQAEIYHDFVLPAATFCSLDSYGIGPASTYTPTIAQTSFTQPQYKPLTSSTTAPKAPAWWETELAEDIHKTLRKRENSLNKLQFKSPQLYCREEIVDFLTAVCKELDISTGIRHFAVRLMDHFMDGHNVMEYRLRLMALTCLLIAAKAEESDDHLPTIEMLQHAAHMNSTSNMETYSRQEFHTLELYTLKYFKWSVFHPSAAHFVDYYLHLSMKDASINLSQREQKLLNNQLQEFSTYFMETTLRDSSFLSYKPSEVAAAAVCVARFCSGMGTAWSLQLEEATSYSLENLEPIASLMLSLNKGFQHC